MYMYICNIDTMVFFTTPATPATLKASYTNGFEIKKTTPKTTPAKMEVIYG